MEGKGKIFFIPVRIFLYAAVAGVFAWLVFRDLVVGGTLEAQYDFGAKSPFISVLRPQGRLSGIEKDERGDYFQGVKEEPVYFDVRLPRTFEKAEITFRYKNAGNPVIELGAMTDKERWLFDLKPLENRVIEYLLQDKFHWSYIREGDRYLFQKKGKFQTISDFLKNLPQRSSIASYHYDIGGDFILPEYSPGSGGTEILKTLRGTHRMYTYVKDEPLELSFWFQDVNRHAGDDYVSIDIAKKDETIFEEFYKIDDNALDNRVMSEIKEVNIALPGLSEGVYKVEIITPSDDIFIRKATTTQEKLVFLNTVYLGDNVGYSDEYQDEKMAPTKLFTNGRAVGAMTTHIEGLQTILIDENIIHVSDTHKKYFAETPSDLSEVLVPRNDVLIETRGLFSFSKESFFNPDITTLSDGRNFSPQSIEYVLTNYSPPKNSAGGWRENTITFDIGKYFTLDDELHFVISLPYKEKEKTDFFLSEISVKLSGERLTWKKIIQKILDYGKSG